MKKISLLLILLFNTSLYVNSQTTFVPDDGLESRLIQLGLDSGPLDDLVLTGNIDDLEDFDFGNFIVSDITGLQDFVSLIDLRVDGEISDLSPIEGLVSLQELVIRDVIDTELDLSALVNLTYINISDSAISSLDFSNAATLSELNLENMTLSDIVFANNTLLEDAYLNFVNVPELVFTDCTSLRTLFVGNSSTLTNLDVSESILLESIEFDDNSILPQIDLSLNVALGDVRAEDNLLLETIFIKSGNNTNIGTAFRVKDNPILSCIEVDDVAWSNLFWGANTNNFSGFSLTCSTPILIPDPNFEQALIDLGIDTDGIVNGEMEEIDALGVTDLDVNSYNIADLTGIEFFTDLEVLTAFNNNLSSVDLSQNSALTTILLALNNLTEIDLSSHPNLISLSLNDNSISTIDLSNNLQLQQVFLNNNLLSEVDVDMLSNLANLGVSGNTIVELDLSNNTLLQTLFCQDNNLVNLNVQNGNNTNVTNFEAENNSNLTCIQVDDISYSTANWTLIDSQSFFGLDCAPSNDGCNEATQLDLGIVVTGTTQSATSSGLSPSCQQNGIILIDVWYEFEAPLSGSITVVANSILSSIKVAIYDDCANGAPIACDSAGIVVNNLNPGQTYYAQVWVEALLGGRSQDTLVGDFDIQVADSSTLSDEENLVQEVQLFPNPASSQVTIKTHSGIDTISIFDVAGKEVLQVSTINQNDYVLNVQSLSKGIYLLQIHGQNTIMNKRLLIK